MSKLTPVQRLIVFEMLKQGWTRNKISKFFTLNRNSIYSMLKRRQRGLKHRFGVRKNG